MVVDYRAMSSVDFAIPDFCSLIPNVADEKTVSALTGE
jgi:hypothetical protein